MQAKDLTFFEDLFKQYYSILRSYAMRYVGDENAAEDIVQDVFFDLWQNRNKIDFEESIKPYLFKATFNRSLNHIKSKYISSRVSIEDNIDYSIEQYIHSLTTYQEDNLLMQDISNEVRSFVDNLPEQRRKVFTLSRSLGLSNKEIAEQLQVSVKAVEKQITKVLSALREHLKDKGFTLIVALLIIGALFRTINHVF